MNGFAVSFSSMTSSVASRTVNGGSSPSVKTAGAALMRRQRIPSISRSNSGSNVKSRALLKSPLNGTKRRRFLKATVGGSLGLSFVVSISVCDGWNQNHEWSVDGPVFCGTCGHHRTVASFTKAGGEDGFVSVFSTDSPATTFGRERVLPMV